MELIIGGKCPVCDFDKMVHNVGTDNDYQFDGCPKCGFGYGSIVNKDKKSDVNYNIGIKAWLNLTTLILFKEYKDLIPEEMKYKFCICYHETLQMKDNNFIEYNNCNFHNTGICTCRNIDLSNCYSSSTTK